MIIGEDEGEEAALAERGGGGDSASVFVDDGFDDARSKLSEREGHPNRALAEVLA